MKIGILQINICKDINENIIKISKIISNNNADIFILPELSDRGYLYNNREELFSIATELEKNILINKLKNITLENKKSVIVEVAEKDGDKIYNSAIVIDKGYLIGTYRKIHLTDFEKNFFEVGKENKVFEVQGVSIGLQVCFDVWFPEISREQIDLGANLIFISGNFGGVTTYEICKIRAIENLTPIILCNRVGKEVNNNLSATFLGNSTIYNYDGTQLIFPLKEKERYLEFDIQEFRKNSNIMCKDFNFERKKEYFCRKERKNTEISKKQI
ncbi:MAG: carbon-nitrogen hydrolase family protein [Fusobacterium mortiferum]|nr:carbon-nitrogen hydrolase family protein [Fusobacterium mortiferum]